METEECFHSLVSISLSLPGFNLEEFTNHDGARYDLKVVSAAFQSLAVLKDLNGSC
jgi:hypothetical protein